MQLVSLTIRPKKSHSPRAVANSLRSALAVERRTVLRRFREANNVTAIVFHWLNDWSVGHLNFWLILNTSRLSGGPKFRFYRFSRTGKQVLPAQYVSGSIAYCATRWPYKSITKVSPPM